MIVLNCHCGRKLQIREEHAGKQGKCPVCGRTLDIPHLDASRSYSPQEAEPIIEARLVEEPEPAPQEAGPTDHLGRPLAEDADFFVAAPEEIGPLVSCHTTLREGVTPWSPELRWLIISGFAILGVVVPLLISAVVLDRWDPVLAVIVCLLVGVIAGGASWVATRFRHRCTYVGQEGIARYVCSGNRDHLVTSEVFLFRSASDLRTSQTRHYTNGVYQHTAYSFTWTDVAGRTCYVLSGTYRSKEGNPPAKSPFHFARAAENAWTGYLLGSVSRQVDLAGSVLFNLRKGGWIRLGPEKILFCLRKEEDEWSAAEVGRITVENGQVRFRHVHARSGLFSSSGIYQVAMEDLANAHLFFFLLTRLVGVSIE